MSDHDGQMMYVGDVGSGCAHLRHEHCHLNDQDIS